MRILIISDAHLFHKYAITCKKYHNILLKELNNIDIIVDCGDLTDKSTLTAPQLDELSNIFVGIDKPIYLVAGNHDSLNNTTTVSVFNNFKNITIIKSKPAIINNILFIPYTDNIKQLYKDLDEIIKEPIKIAFSHLTITDSIYATIPFNSSKDINKYAINLFNGHIHTPQEHCSIYGNIFNIGACSSLTFGDEHLPCYIIYDTDTDKFERFSIEETFIHKTYELSSTDIVQEIQNTNQNYLKILRFKLPNESNSIQIAKDIRNKLCDIKNVLEISFDYVKTKQQMNKKDIKNININKKTLVEQLIENFQKDNNIILDNDIKKELL